MLIVGAGRLGLVDVRRMTETLDSQRHPQRRSRHSRFAHLVVGGLALGVFGTLAGCGSSGEAPTSDAAATATAPAGAVDGAALYQAKCASCHGADLRGTSTGPSHLSLVYEPSHHGDDGFRSAIANGAQQHHWNFGNMAAIPGLSTNEVDAIIAYVRDVQVREGFEPYPPA